MAGALRFFRYDSDDGKEYGFRLDRTNSVATVTVGGQPVFPTLAGGAPIGLTAPRGLSPRYANTYSKDDPSRRRKFPIGNIPAYQQLAGQVNPTITAEGFPGDDDTPGTSEVWIVSSLVGEKRVGIPNSTVLGGGLQN
jgi:hypothetical protein